MIDFGKTLYLLYIWHKDKPITMKAIVFFLTILLLLFILNNKSNAQWSADPLVNTDISTTAGEQTIPKIVSSISYPGISYVSWFSNESGNYNVRLQKLDVYGNKLWADDGLLISSHTAMSWLTDWDMAIDGDDCAIITFQDVRTGSNNIFAYRISPDGDFLWGNDGIQLSNTTSFDASPKVIVTNVGNVIIAWSADDVIIRQKISPAGNLLWGVSGITLTGSNTYSWPQLLPIGNDDVIMKYFEDIGTFPNITRHVYAQRFDVDGADVWAQAAVISNAGGISSWTQIFPIINDGSDGFFTAWHDDRDNNMRASIFVQHISSSGQILFPANGVEASDLSDRNHYYAQLALPVGSDDVFVYWNEMDANQNDRGLYGQKMSSTGTILWNTSGKVFIEISATNVYPIASRGTENDMLLIYEEYFDALNTSIRAMRIDVNGSYIWTSENVMMSGVQSEKLHPDVNNFYFDQLIVVWGDSRNTSNDIYGQNIQLDGNIGSIPPLFNANFSVSNDSICKDVEIQFTDNSIGEPTSWNWNFEGGTPSTSTDQNPLVTYSSSGFFDVELITSNGTSTDTLLREDYIFVYYDLEQADTPVGSTDVCQGIEEEYTTNPVQYAESYQWEVEPSDAGSISGTGTTGYFEPSNSFTGSFSVKVRAQNECYNGIWSPDFNCIINMSPQIFMFDGDPYCEGEPGSELILDGSEIAVDYELFLDDVTTGIILAGTGSAISFGYFTEEGLYRVNGYTSFCNTYMAGTPWVHEIYPPEQAATPIGQEAVCNDTVTTYSTTGAVNADSFVWILSPPEAGIMTPDGIQVNIDWSSTYNGMAYLSVYGVNECGGGDVSDELEIEVVANPTPIITGDTLVCQFHEGYIYYTPDNSDNIFNWEISGGEIITGLNTNEITVNWDAYGIGWIKVLEVTPEGCATATDNYIVTIDECTLMMEIASDDFTIYPNPASNILNLELISQTNSDIEIKILDVMGRTILFSKMKIVDEVTSLNICELDQGIYIIEVSNSDFGKITKRFMVN